METDLNSIMVTSGYILTIFGGLSALAVGHYYSRKASVENKPTQAEFNRGIILFTVACFGFGSWNRVCPIYSIFSRPGISISD